MEHQWASPGDIAELDRQIERGSLFTQASLERSFHRLNNAEALLSRVIDRLVANGLMTEDELGVTLEDAEDAQQPEDDGEDPPSPASIAWPSIALRVDNDNSDDVDRDPPTVAAVDCVARMAVCQAVCCKLKFPLSPEEVDGGRLKWDIGHPYVIRHASNGYCVHNDTATGHCGVYSDRPGVCRRYSCVGDTRIWSDFDGMVLNHEWLDAHLPARELHVAAVVPEMEVVVSIGTKPSPGP